MDKSSIEYFKLIMDPNSYAKTILNAFNLSLALRLQYVGFDFNSDGLFVVIPSKSQGDSYRHSILELTPAQYRNILDRLNIQKAIL